jgi:hypothetical protein
MLRDTTPLEKLTLKDLTKDLVGEELGYWSRDVQVNNKRYRLIICKTATGYLVADGLGPTILNKSKTLEEVITFYNDFIQTVHTHDLTVFQNAHKTIVLGTR